VEDKKADVTIEDLNGRTPLHYAALITPESVSRFHTEWASTPLTQKTRHIDNYRELVFQVLDLLLQSGADINK
jgi:hypothetical protein